MEFLVDSLKRNPKSSYADLKGRADEKKLQVFPIMFGRAQALLGIVKSAKRGEGKVARARAAVKAGKAPGAGKRGRRADPSSKSGRVRALLATGLSAAEIAKKVGCTTALVYNIKSSMGKAVRRGPGRPPKAAGTTVGLDSLAGIVDAVRNAERERNHLRSVLERLQAVVADALA